MGKGKSDIFAIAELSARTQLTSQLLAIVSDPLWSTVLGFATVHELRKRDLIGPLADDILYAGIIAVNTARTPGLASLAGQGLGTLLPAIAGIGVPVAAAAGGVGGAATVGLGGRAIRATKSVVSKLWTGLTKGKIGPGEFFIVPTALLTGIERELLEARGLGPSEEVPM